MTVMLDPKLEAKLQQLAVERGRDAESLVSEAVERLVDYERWVIRKAGIPVDAKFGGRNWRRRISRNTCDYLERRENREGGAEDRGAASAASSDRYILEECLPILSAM